MNELLGQKFKTKERNLFFDAKIGRELKDFEGEETERAANLEEKWRRYITDLIPKVHHLIGLETYFTTGETETRAWTIERGSILHRLPV